MTGSPAGDVEKRGRATRRLEREKKTIRLMVRIHCSGRHGTGQGLCGECRKLLDYALARIDRCPYRGRKPACNVCPVHCYRHLERDEIREVMRYAGPRMLWRHPLLAFFHLLDAWRGKSGAAGRGPVTPPE